MGTGAPKSSAILGKLPILAPLNFFNLFKNLAVSSEATAAPCSAWER
jgi:hypothetical protein